MPDTSPLIRDPVGEVLRDFEIKEIHSEAFLRSLRFAQLEGLLDTLLQEAQQYRPFSYSFLE